MKKIRNVVLILALFLCFNGCEKNPAEVATSSSNDELTVVQAKAFVETQRMNEFTLKSGKSERKRINIRSDWNKSERSNNGDISVVETQIEAMGQFGFATPDCMEAWNTSKNDAYLYSMSRLVVIKNKKSGEMYSFIMSVVGDKHYLEEKKFKIWDNAYLKRDKDLSGFVLFHDLSGAFVNGWIYCDGQITNSIIKPIDLDLTINLKSAMILLEIYDWVKECSDWQYNYVASDGTPTIVSKRCTERFVVVGYYETGGSGNGSSGGSTGGSTPGSYTPPIQPCNCLDRCPTCGKCIGSTLKSAIVPGGGTTTTTPTTDPCESCTGHPVPVVDATDFQNNAKANCIYQKLLNAGILQDFISRYFGGTQPNASFLGELNLTWDLDELSDEALAGSFPIGEAGNGRYAVEITLDESLLNTSSATIVALAMLHEALHAKMIAEYYDTAGTTDLKSLYANYINAKNMDYEQEKAMLDFYSSEMANALYSFDQSQGINHTLDFYKEAVRYNLAKQISSSDYTTTGSINYSLLANSLKICK